MQHGTDLQIDKTMMAALTEGNIKSAIVNIMDIYLLPSSEDFKNYPDFLEMKFMLDKEKIETDNSTTLQREMSRGKNKELLTLPSNSLRFVMSTTLSSLTYRQHYPSLLTLLFTQLTLSLSCFRHNSGRWTVQKPSLEYLQQMYNDYANVDFDILGVLAALLKNNVGLDSQILKDAETDFGKDMLFNQIIRHMEQLKRYDRTGIAEKGLTKYDMHDTRVHYIYNTLTQEIVTRLKDKGGELK